MSLIDPCQNCPHYGETHGFGKHWGEVVAETRNLALEEAAKLADEQHDATPIEEGVWVATSIAKSIRGKISVKWDKTDG